jgi:hypothetical protein
MHADERSAVDMTTKYLKPGLWAPWLREREMNWFRDKESQSQLETVIPEIRIPILAKSSSKPYKLCRVLPKLL